MSALFSPIKLGQTEFANRIVVSPMCQYSSDDGSPTDWHMAHLGMLANCGAGLVIVEATHVERHGRITHGCAGLYSDHNEAAWRRVIEHCRRAGTAKWGVQIAHAGRKASAQRPWEGGGALTAAQDPWETISPSPIPFGSNWHVPREATLDDIARVRDAFVSSAKRAVRVGFDAIELHYAHGYLAHSFLSPMSNHRTDQYGGSLQNRMRLGLEIAQAVRAAVSASITLGARITGNDWREADGLSTDDAVTYAKALKAAGLDYIDVSSGGITADTRNPPGPGYNVPIAERVKREAAVATRVVGLITAPAQAEAIVGDGKADMVALGRGMLDDPRWGWHAAAALGAEVPRVKQYLRAGPKLWAPAAGRRV
ncbi:MAG: NADH:flavin oxidoreductase/NADH oxidase [Alphaproteobacteria bacterium]|nr:NADH:flavin oxidoreductase/NADH oxidase [Alphaproteobacteria bacterium]